LLEFRNSGHDKKPFGALELSKGKLKWAIVGICWDFGIGHECNSLDIIHGFDFNFSPSSE